MIKMRKATYSPVTFPKPLVEHRKGNIFPCCCNLVRKELKILSVRNLYNQLQGCRKGTRPLASIQPDGPAGNSVRGNIQSPPGC